MAEVKVRGDVPGSVHPDVLKPHEKALEGVPALALAREVMETLYETWADIEDTHVALVETARGERYTPREGATAGMRSDGARLRVVHGREREFSEAVTKAFERAAGRADARVGELRRARDKLAAAVEGALFDKADGEPAAIALAQEIRAHVRGLKAESDRLKFLSDAAAARDRRTLAAVLSAPRYLSGLTADHHAAVLAAARSHLAPTEAKQLAALEATIETVMAASGRFVERYSRALKLSDVAVKKQGRADDMLAILTGGKKREAA